MRLTDILLTAILLHCYTAPPHPSLTQCSLLTVSDEGADPVLQMREQSDAAAVIRGPTAFFK
ncbi:MAG TPA: hypothetical protein DCG24_00765 [Bacteroidetes bacterium]|nr:hypothetical protein [Bacteroidota bacterium]